MHTLAVVSLSGGQGKTTTALFLSKLLAQKGYPTLLIDADPQHNLTTFMGFVDLSRDQPTLLEVLKETVAVTDAIYSVEGHDNLFLIPADDQLDTAQEYLPGTGAAAIILKLRLEPLMGSEFKFCIIDSPPQRSQICLTVIGAADGLIVPTEANLKGYGSLERTLELLTKLTKMRISTAKLLGVIPFRDRWFGLSRSKESREAIEAMEDAVGAGYIIPSIRESEQYKRAINAGVTLAESGHQELEYPFEVLIEKILELASS